MNKNLKKVISSTVALALSLGSLSDEVKAVKVDGDKINLYKLNFIFFVYSFPHFSF